MPTYRSAEDTITARFGTHWSYTPVAYPNVTAVNETLSGRPELSLGQDPFIAVTVMYGASLAAEVGVGAIKRTHGNLLVELYTKEDDGTLQNRINLDYLAELFEYQTVDNICFRDITVLPPSDKNGWYITPAMVRFYFNR